MNVADIGRLLRYKMRQHGAEEKDSGRLVMTGTQVDAIVTEVAAELAVRMSRPVITFTRADVLNAAAAAGFTLKTVDIGPTQMVVPADKYGNDLYDAIHKVSDYFVCLLLERLPEVALREETKEAVGK